MARLNLDQLINQANSFSANLDELESRIRQVDPMHTPFLVSSARVRTTGAADHVQLSAEMTESLNAGLSRREHEKAAEMASRSLRVPGGVDSQSLETVLELRDLDLMLMNSGHNDGTDPITSRLDMRQYNNSSSLSNFILPQTTYRTNRSYRSGQGYFLINNSTIAPNNGGTTLRTIVHGKVHNTSISIPQHGKKPSSRHLMASYSGGNQIRTQHNQSQRQPSVGNDTSSGSGPENRGPNSGPQQVVGAILDEIAHNRGQLQSILQFINDIQGKGTSRGSPEADPGTDAPAGRNPATRSEERPAKISNRFRS